MTYYLGIDLGGTNIAVGLCDIGGHLLCKKSAPTPPPGDPAALCAAIRDVCAGLLEENGYTPADVQSAGIGSPGILRDGVILYANNLRLRDVPLAAILEKELNLPVTLANDGSAAAYGEFIAGAGVGRSSLIAVTLGTGIGGGVILDNRLFEGGNRTGCEIGHMTIRPGGRVCTCGKQGCFEAYASATGLIRDTKEAMDRHPDSLLCQIAPTPDLVNGKSAFDGLRAGDAVAIRVVGDFIENLAIGIHNLIVLFQPEVICLGGGIAREGDTLLIPLQEKLRAMYLSEEYDSVEITTAKLGNDAGIIGAAMLGVK